MSRKIFAKLKFDIEKYPKTNYYKGKKGTYGEIDIVINVDDPYEFPNGGKTFSNVSLPQTKEDEKNKVPRTYLDGWNLVINSVGHSETLSDGSRKYIRDEEWYKNHKQDTVQDTVSDKGDLPF